MLSHLWLGQRKMDENFDDYWEVMDGEKPIAVVWEEQTGNEIVLAVNHSDGADD